MHSISMAPGHGAQGGNRERLGLQSVFARGQAGLTSSVKAKEEWGLMKLRCGVTETLWSFEDENFLKRGPQGVPKQENYATRER